MRASFLTTVVLLALVLSLASAESVKEFLHKFAKDPAAHLQGKALRGATMVFSEDGRQAPLARYAESVGSQLEVPFEGWDIEVDTQGKMAWFKQRGSEGFAAKGGVLVNNSGAWQFLQLNVTGTFEEHSKRQVTMPRKPFDISVMSFNLRYGTANDGKNSWYNRDYLVFKVFNDYQATLVGVQEALHFQLEEIHASVTGYQWIGVGRDDGKEAGEYSAIFYKTDVLELIEQGTFWYCDTPDVPGCTSYGNSIPRIATWGHFRHKATGETFRHYNTHYDHQSTNSRERSSEQLIKHIQQNQDGGAFFVTGDLNCNSETSPEIVHLKNAGFDDSFRVLYPNATNVGTFNNFVGTTTGTKIDFVFTPRTAELGGPIQVNQALIIHDNDNGRYPSDHFPVYAHVTFASRRD